MGLLNYEKARIVYKQSEFMLQIIDCLEDMDEYHLLRDSSINKYSNEANLRIPDQYLKWLSICDGGLLFSTTLLSIKEYDDQLDMQFSTIGDFNAEKKRAEYRVPDGYFIFAILNYGDLVSISYKDSRVYLWDVDSFKFTTVWESFDDFIADEYNTALQMIDDGALDPVPLKEGLDG